MNSLLKMIVKNPDDKGVLLQLENYLKRNWRRISPEKSFYYLPFFEAFSDLLVHIEKFKVVKQKDAIGFFRGRYANYFDKLTLSTRKLEGVDQKDPIKYSKLRFDNLEPSEYLILFGFLNGDRKNKSPEVVEILRKVRYNSRIDDSNLINDINKMNLISLYLIDELGYKKFREFTDFIDLLGLYYPYGQIPDSDVVLKIKDRLLNKFVDSISNTNVDNISAIEKLLF